MKATWDKHGWLLLAVPMWGACLAFLAACIYGAIYYPAFFFGGLVVGIAMGAIR